MHYEYDYDCEEANNDRRGGCCGCIILVLAIIGLVTVLQHLTWK